MSWNVDNRITSVSQVSGNESYTYDADGERATRTRGSTTTLYIEGLWEESAGGAAQIAYTFNNEVVAVRDSGTNAVTYLHTDQIGSVSLATSASGVGTLQEYYPWGTHRGGDTLSQTTLDYTGQRADATGLLYYHARYYDPALGRFFSPDTQAPDAGTPQALNPYSYVHNNPIRYNDPSGHCIPFLSSDCAPVWQTGQGLNTHDFAQYSAGVVEGMGSLGAAAASLSKPETWDAAGAALSSAIADPPAAAAAAVDQGKAMVENAAAVISDPGGTVAALNDNPRALGRALGGAAANLALAAAGGGGSAATEAEEGVATTAEEGVAAESETATLGETCSFPADTPVATDHGEQPIAPYQSQTLRVWAE